MFVHKHSRLEGRQKTPLRHSLLTRFLQNIFLYLHFCRGRRVSFMCCINKLKASFCRVEFYWLDCEFQAMKCRVSTLSSPLSPAPIWKIKTKCFVSWNTLNLLLWLWLFLWLRNNSFGNGFCQYVIDSFVIWCEICPRLRIQLYLLIGLARSKQTNENIIGSHTREGGREVITSNGSK